MTNTLETDLDQIRREYLLRVPLHAQEMKLHKQRRDALANCDALKYTNLCFQLGITDIEDRVLYQVGLKEMSQRPHFKLPIAYAHSDSSNKHSPVTARDIYNPKPFKLVELVHKHGRVSVDAVMEQTDLKTRLLSQAGYKGATRGKAFEITVNEEEDPGRNLKGIRKVPNKVNLIDASPGRIGSMFKKIYYQGIINNRKQQEELLEELREASESFVE